MQKRFLIFSAALTAFSIVSGMSLPVFAGENFIEVPMTRQATDYTCGAAAMQSMFGYFGEDLNEGELAKLLKTNDQEGTDYNEIVKVATEKGYKVNVYKDMTLNDLKKLLDKKIPVLCLIQAWATKKIDYATDWQDGHYVVAIGYDRNRIIFMDPSTLGNYTYIKNNDFLKRWHDKNSKEKLNHFGLTIKKSKSKSKKDSYKAGAIKFMP